MALVHLNGHLMPAAEACVPAMDRGFLFGDGVYEVIPVYSRRPFRLAEHLARLQRSLDAVRIANPHDAAGWAALIGELVAGGESDDQSVYLQVTRGTAPVRNHAFPKDAVPTVFAMSEALSTPPAEQRERGVATVSAADNRWHRCDIKAISLLANCLLRQQAVDAGATETVLFRDGILTEGAAANIFAVKDGMLLAPQKNHLMLPGITYDVMLELAGAHGQPLDIREIGEAELRAADEVWMTSSTKEILAITTLDGVPVGTGRPGPVGEAMRQWYQDFKNTVMRNG